MTKLSPAADHGDLPARVQHPFHPHSLQLVPDDDGVEFRCNGCEVSGAGVRYECERGAACNLDLHIRCALAPSLRKIGGDHWFELHHSPPDAGRHRRICDACGGAATGFVYHCAELDHDVHPCCAGLPETLDLAGIFFKLRMKDDALQGRSCAFCVEKKTRWGGRSRVNRGCWSYRSVRGCGDDDVFLHVACVKDLACDDSFTSASLGEAMAARASDTGTRSVVDASRVVYRSDPDSFTSASLGEAMAARASDTGTRSVVDASRVVYRSDPEMVSAALRALLLKGQGGRGHRGRGGRLLRVLSIIVRVVIGVIFGDPTAMLVAVGGAIFTGDG